MIKNNNTPETIDYAIEPTPEAVLRLFTQVKFLGLPDKNYEKHTEQLAHLQIIEQGIETVLSHLKNGDPVKTRNAQSVLQEMLRESPGLYDRMWPIIEATVAARFPEHALEKAGFPVWERNIQGLVSFGENFQRTLREAPLLQFARRFGTRLPKGVLLLLAFQGACRDLPEQQNSSAEIDAAAMVAEPLTTFQKVLQEATFDQTLIFDAQDLPTEIMTDREKNLDHGYTQSELFEILSMQRSFDRADVRTQIELSMKSFPEEWGFAPEDVQGDNPEFEQSIERVQKRVWDFISFVGGDFGTDAVSTHLQVQRRVSEKKGAGAKPVTTNLSIERQQQIIGTWLASHSTDITNESHHISLYEEFVSEQEMRHPGPAQIARLLDDLLPWGVVSFSVGIGTGHRSYNEQVNTLINAANRLDLDTSAVRSGTRDSLVLRPLHEAVKKAGVLVAYPGTSNHGGGKAVDIKMPNANLAPLHSQVGRVLDAWAEQDDRIKSIKKERGNGRYGVHHINATADFIDGVVEHAEGNDAIAQLDDDE
jgi:hypothetical protein